MRSYLTLLALIIGSSASLAAATRITVDGTLLEFNGATEVPAGLFGVHAVPLNPERIADWGIEADRSLDQDPSGKPRNSPTPILVECFFDRYQPALILNDPNWEDRLEKIARRYATGSHDLDRQPIVEFWNEPYLNWAVNPGVNYDGGLYRGPAKAGETMRTKIGNDPVEGLVWDEPRPVAIREFEPGKNAIDYLATRFMPKDLHAGDTFSWRDRPYRVEDRWWGRDINQPVSWWSGPVNREFYHRMLKPFAETLKNENPDVTLVVGWGFHLNESNWQAWETLHKPLIDFAHEWMDGYNEHHYGGNTRMVAGTYETAYAYTLGQYGKKLKFYNTEAGGMLDPERPGTFDSAVRGSPVDQARGAYTYMVRDVLHLIDVSPDKAVTRFAHEAHRHKGGTESAFKLFKPLRGQLVEATSTDPNIWAVASLDGDSYTVIVFNDHYQPKEVEVEIQAPQGYALDGGTIARAVVVPEQGLALEESVLAYADGNSQHRQSLRIPGKDAVRYHFELHREAAVEPEVIRYFQFPAPEILQTARPGEPVTFTVGIPASDLYQAESALLRFVHDSNLRWRSEDLRITLNGTVLEGRASTDYLVEFEIPRGLLRTENILAFHVAPETKPILICTASILLVSKP